MNNRSFSTLKPKIGLPRPLFPPVRPTIGRPSSNLGHILNSGINPPPNLHPSITQSNPISQLLIPVQHVVNTVANSGKVNRNTRGIANVINRTLRRF